MASEGMRSCGECTVCCTALVIDTPEFRKTSGVTCANCTAQGCGIYETRYPICRSYFCGWIQLPELDDTWRPDRSGVIVTPQAENIPPEFAVREGVELLAVGGERALRREAFAVFVLRLVRNEIAVFLAVPGPRGHYPARALLNRVLAKAAATNDLAAATDTLLQMYKAAAGHTFEPTPF